MGLPLQPNVSIPPLPRVGRVPTVPRGEFVRRFGEAYQSGQHATFLGPTQRGKTTLAHQLLAVSANSKRKAIVLAGKPPDRDPRMAAAAGDLNLRVVETWPPSPGLTQWHKDKKRHGWVLRPEHDMSDNDKTNANLQHHFRNAMIDGYRTDPDNPRIVVVDEGHHVSKDLRLQGNMDSILMRGAPVVSLWTLVQRGRWMSYQIYDAPEHIFIAHDPDLNNRRRYSEFGGIDPKQIESLTANLQTYTVESGGTISQFLYVRRSGPEMCIVDVS